MFKAAARNKEGGANVIALLLARYGASVTITEDIYKAAAGNEESSKKIMALLLARPGAGLINTEKVVIVNYQVACLNLEPFSILKAHRPPN